MALRHSHSIPGLLFHAIALVLLSCSVSAQDFPGVPPVAPGDRFPAISLPNVNVAAGEPETIDLASVLGKKPVILYYWIPETRRSETVFQELQELVDEIGRDRIALFGVAVPRPGRGVDLIQDRLRVLSIDVPVLEDTEFRLGQQLRVSSVPNISLIDAEGRLRLTNGGSLNQVLGYEVDVRRAIQVLTDSGKLMTYGALGRYYPVRELEGRMAPDFEAPLLRTNEVRSWHGLLDDEKLNVLIFWSVQCPHCREYLPQISRWLDENPDGVNVVSCADVNSVEAMNKTREFCETNELGFPTLVDNQTKVGTLYKVTSTPTIVIIGPDGVVDSAMVSGYSDFGTKIEDKKRQLLK